MYYHLFYLLLEYKLWLLIKLVPVTRIRVYLDSIIQLRPIGDLEFNTVQQTNSLHSVYLHHPIHLYMVLLYYPIKDLQSK